MSVAVYYDGSGNVTRVDRSANTPVAQAAGALINPDLSAVEAYPVSEWKVELGAVIHNPPALADVQASHKQQLLRDALGLISSRYNLDQLVMLYATAVQGGKVNRAAQVKQALSWCEAVLNEQNSKATATDVETQSNLVNTHVTDWDVWIGSNPDPQITVASILAITT